MADYTADGDRIPDPPMTKTEAREWLRRSRQGLALAERALREGLLHDLQEAMVEVTAAAAAVQNAAETDGVRGLE